MATFTYTRSGGKRRTYEIQTNQSGSYLISLNGKVLKQGCEPLVVRGLRRPGRDAEESSLRYAKVAVDYLLGMSEE